MQHHSFKHLHNRQLPLHRRVRAHPAPYCLYCPLILRVVDGPHQPLLLRHLPVQIPRGITKGRITNHPRSHATYQQ